MVRARFGRYERRIGLRRTRLAPAALAAVALTSGCGSSQNAQSPRQAWLAAAVAMANGDGAKACAAFSPSVKNTLVAAAHTSCPAAVKELASGLTASDRAGVAHTKITSVSVSGSTATILYKLNPGLGQLGFTGRSRLVESNGKWLIAPRTGGR